MPRRAILLCAFLVLAGCGGSTSQLTVSHRQVPKSDARIVVLPVGIPAGRKDIAGSGRTLATLYATELLRNYSVLEWESFERTLKERKLAVDSLLVGTGPETARELGVDGLLLSEVYDWKPGKPGILFLAKKGKVGFQARLVDLSTGSVLWSVNRVRETEPDDSLPAGLARVFRDLAAEMPSELTPN